jgi:DNA-directed RNA polymerase specialized sigma24 family protein
MKSSTSRSTIIWHRETRHLTTPKERFNDDGDEYDTSEPLMKEVADDRVFRKDEIERAYQDEYEGVCKWIRTALGKKQDWADMFIAVRIDGMSIREYASSIGADENNITQKLKRATKKLEQEYKNRQI